jgi:hypothetical protein
VGSYGGSGNEESVIPNGVEWSETLLSDPREGTFHAMRIGRSLFFFFRLRDFVRSGIVDRGVSFVPPTALRIVEGRGGGHMS